MGVDLQYEALKEMYEKAEREKLEPGYDPYKNHPLKDYIVRDPPRPQPKPPKGLNDPYFSPPAPEEEVAKVVEAMADFSFDTPDEVSVRSCLETVENMSQDELYKIPFDKHKHFGKSHDKSVDLSHSALPPLSRKETLSFSIDDYIRIMERAKQIGAASLSFGQLRVAFASPGPEAPQASQPLYTPAQQASEQSKIESIDKNLLEDMRRSQMLIEDPLAFEQEFIEAHLSGAMNEIP